ncbi:MAG: hypothetical protein ACYC8T_15780 [Myxococcaceae bacterium]
MRTPFALRSLTLAALLAATAAGAQESGFDAFPAPPPPKATDTPTLRFERYSASAGQRIGMETLGAGLGVGLGVVAPLAIAAATCRVEEDFACQMPLLFGVPGGIFVPSIGVFMMGAVYDGAGGYWLSVAGSTTGWLTAYGIYSLVNPGNGDVAAVLAIILGVLPISGAVAGYEVSSLRTLARSLPPAPPVRVSLAPWISPDSRGLVLQGAF